MPTLRFRSICPSNLDPLPHGCAGALVVNFLTRCLNRDHAKPGRDGEALVLGYSNDQCAMLRYSPEFDALVSHDGSIPVSYR